MNVRFSTVAVWTLAACSAATAAKPTDWWNNKWRFRTTVTGSVPCRDDRPRPVEAAVDFPLLLNRAGVGGEFDPASLRVVERVGRRRREVPFARRGELETSTGRERSYLAWIAETPAGRVPAAEIYFDTKDRRLPAARYDAKLLPPENLLANAGFEDLRNDLPAKWDVSPAALLRTGRFAHTTGRRSLKVVVDANTPKGARRDVTISQRISVGRFAGQQMVFECDLLAERAVYGAPVSVELMQFRADGSRIGECAVQPRWLTIELAEGQLVRLRQRGRFSHEAAGVTVRVRMRCSVHDADSGQLVTGPESRFTVWLDRLVVRPGRRLPWPAATNGGFVPGALETAPLNRAFEFTGLRRLAFNGASEATLTDGRYNPNPRSVHWGLRAGTLEFWCRPSWDADDGAEHVFFEGVAYGHRRQSRLRKLGAGGRNRLEFTIADAAGTARTVRGRAPLKAGRWHHVAATWDFPKAQLQLFLDGKRIAATPPGAEPWPSSLLAVGKKRRRGIGIADSDARSMPMQAFLGGGRGCRPDLAAEAAIDEFRISDVARYAGSFDPPRKQVAVDEHTRALFHFENDRHGVHDSDDRFVRGHLACELPRRKQHATLETLTDGKVEARSVLVRPHASRKLFEANRPRSRLPVRRRFGKLPDPGFIEYRRRSVERTVSGGDEGFVLTVGGDYEPLMRSITFARAAGAGARTTLLPRWRANDNVVPFNVEALRQTLAHRATGKAEKALEVFRYALRTTNYYDAHYCETLPNRHRPRVSYTLIKSLNIYPFDQCGPLNYTLRKLFLTAGISSNDASGTHHQFQQAFYGGRWRLFDLSPRLYWLNRDNATVAGRRAFEADPYLKLRQGSEINSALRGRRSRARFGSAQRPHRMDFALRRGERASVCWHNEGRWFEVTGKRAPIPLAKIPPYFGNGAIVYEPAGEGEAAERVNLAVQRREDGSSALRARDPAKPASLVYRARCPYIFSDAQVRGACAAGQPGAVRLSLSFDGGKRWKEVWRSAAAGGAIAADLRRHVTGRYAYRLKLELRPGAEAAVTALKVRSTFVASPLALPGKLRRGENRIRFVGGRAAVPVKTVCRWVERHRSRLGVSLDAISYTLNGGKARRNVLIAAPGEAVPVAVTLRGRRLRGEVALEGLPAAWVQGAASRPVELAEAAKPATVRFTILPKGAEAGAVRGFDVVVREAARERRVAAQVLVAGAALAAEAEGAEKVTGKAAPLKLPAASGARVMAFSGNGKLTFDLDAPRAGRYALWLRARWSKGSSTRMTLALDKGKARSLRAAARIGFTDWTDPGRAHTKMFAHYGEQYGHWSWYRVPDVQLAPGRQRLTLGAGAGARFDALVLLPQEAATDRAAMNLFQNWNYAPWQNPL